MFFQKVNPIPQIWLTRFLIAVIVVLALVAGYFFTETQRLAARCLPEQDSGTLMNSLLNEKK
ncbi:MAG: hypothetical protein ABI425_01485 [Patescibacteria group bacterium]